MPPRPTLYHPKLRLLPRDPAFLVLLALMPMVLLALMPAPMAHPPATANTSVPPASRQCL